MLNRGRKPSIFTERLHLRLPERPDYADWSVLRNLSEEFLRPWEPNWTPYHLSRGDFDKRVTMARKSFENGTAMPFLVLRQHDQTLVGGISLENIRRGPSQSASVGYWTGKPFVRNGYMKEALAAVVDRVRHVHIRDCKGRQEGPGKPEDQANGRGDIDLLGYVQVLQDHGYTGPLNLEVIGTKAGNYTLEQCCIIAAEARGHMQACLQACGAR